MSFAFFPFYTGDYFRDTRGLSMAGHGCYFLLLTYCWDSQGPLPLEIERIAQICNARSEEECTTMQKILRTYFVQMADGWYQGRVQREIERACALSIKRKSAGAKGYQAKAKALAEQVQAIARQQPLHSHPHPHPHPHSQPEKQKQRDTSASPTARTPGFDTFWLAWPSNPRKVNRKGCLAIWVKTGLEAVAAVIAKHVEAMRGTEQWREFCPAPATYLNQRRWEDGAPVLASIVKRVAL